MNHKGYRKMHLCQIHLSIIDPGLKEIMLTDIYIYNIYIYIYIYILKIPVGSFEDLAQDRNKWSATIQKGISDF